MYSYVLAFLFICQDINAVFSRNNSHMKVTSARCHRFTNLRTEVYRLPPLNKTCNYRTLLINAGSIDQRCWVLDWASTIRDNLRCGGTWEAMDHIPPTGDQVWFWNLKHERGRWEPLENALFPLWLPAIQITLCKIRWRNCEMNKYIWLTIMHMV